MSVPPLGLNFVRSATRVDQLPDSAGEIAFVGRSNVGKSSLINALANRKQLAHVSNTPGRTQVINLFELVATRGGPTGTTFIDLPGYGYAKVAKTQRAAWQPMIERYLIEREPLVMTMVLVDGEIGPTKLDEAMLEWLRHHEIPHSVVATKMDKVKATVRDKRKREVAEKCMLERGDISWVSAAKSTGIDELRSRIRLLLS